MTEPLLPADEPEDLPEPRDEDVDDRLQDTDTPFEEPDYPAAPTSA
jgi:hypothetical protein